MKSIIFTTLILLSFTFNVNAQNYFDEKLGQEYPINQNTDKKIINAYLKEQKATAIEFNPNASIRFPFRLKNKKGNWVLFDPNEDYDDALFMEKDSKKYSYQFPTSLMENSNFTLATSKGKIYFVNLYGNGKIKTKISFDEVKPRVVIDTVFSTNIDGEPEEKHIKHLSSFAVKKDNKWGLIELSDGGIYLSRNFLYDSPEEVPKATGFVSYQLKMMEDIRKNENIDLLVALDQNGYYFKGRDKATQLFGLYMGEGILIAKIPPKYDQIIRHRNPTIYEIWKNGKAGYYNGNHEAVFEPEFDELKYVHLDYTKGVALKRNDKWELYDSYEPIKLMEGSAETIDGLME